MTTLRDKTLDRKDFEALARLTDAARLVMTSIESDTNLSELLAAVQVINATGVETSATVTIPDEALIRLYDIAHAVHHVSMSVGEMVDVPSLVEQLNKSNEFKTALTDAMTAAGQKGPCTTGAVINCRPGGANGAA